MTDPTESLARALTPIVWGQSWAGLSQDARTIALSETRQALTRAASDITEAIAQRAIETAGPLCAEDSDCPFCYSMRGALAAIREWKP